MRRDSQLLTVILKSSMLLVIFALIGLVLSVAGYANLGHPLWAVLCGYLVWVGVLAINSWYGTKLAQADAQEHEWAEKREKQNQSGSRRSLLSRANAEEYAPDRIVVRERYPAFRKTGQWVLWVPALGVWAWSLYNGLTQEAGIASWSENQVRLFATLALVVGICQWLAARYCASLDLGNERAMLAPVQLQSQLSAWLLLLSSAILFLFLFTGIDVTLYWVRFTGWFLLILLLDAIVVISKPLFQPPANKDNVPLHGGTFLTGLLFQRTKATEKIVRGLEKILGASLSEIWFWQVLRRNLPPFLICVFLLFWITSSFTVVPLGYRGVRNHLGAYQETALEPGLHLSLPWPWGKIELTPTERIQKIILGHEVDLGEPILWTEKHYEGEINLLVGDGEELLTLSLPVFYRISDPYRYLTNLRDGQETIVQLAYHYLHTYTVSKDAYEVMSVRRQDIAEQIHRSLQASLDARDAGIEILHVGLKDIHPPLEVAGAYQEVISAQEELRTEIEQGYAYQAELLPSSKQESTRILLSSAAQAVSRVENARGTTAAFSLLMPEYKADPSLFRHLRYFNVLERALAKPEKYIFTQAPSGSLPDSYMLDFRDSLPNRNP